MDFPIRCLGCHLAACSGTCLAAHRAQYACHNPQCIYHRPCPLPIIEPESDSDPEPEPQPQQTPEPEPNNTAEPQGDNTSAGDAANAAATASSPSNADEGFGNLVYRETITREYRLINGQVVQLPQYHPVPVGLTSGTPATTTTNNVVPLDEMLRQIQLHERRLEELERGRQSSRQSSLSRATNGTFFTQRSSRGPQGSPSPSQRSGGNQSHGDCNGHRSASGQSSNAGSRSG